MGRLDDYAKKRIVELRKAGLSFRKIKKVLELDNIRVTPQAIYLFLKRKNVEPSPLPGSNHPLPPRDLNARRLALSRAGWEDEQLWDLLQESEVEPKESLESQPGGPEREPGAGQNWDGKEGIRIVSVTSLCQDGGVHPRDTCSGDAGTGLGAPGPVSPPASPLPLSRGRNSALFVKKKIVDRAIFLHKKATVQSVQSVQSGTGSSSLPLLVGVQSPGPKPWLPDLKDSPAHMFRTWIRRLVCPGLVPKAWLRSWMQCRELCSRCCRCSKC
ncbi:uncharacterized protein LOC122736202 isoform X2 [Dromiciops gliroides]|uniref:uncharacterized protein LOC122736202 isoform X2 n=1 Tax=Dromiciops gliroides TaxID=33562 RepID=UPI001CC494A0|nr:uncharacterized protein LOC122736202 isoform X2 [Dromiciops gliroides]